MGRVHIQAWRQTRGQPAFSVRSQTGNMLDFAARIVSVTAPQWCLCGRKVQKVHRQTVALFQSTLFMDIEMWFSHHCNMYLRVFFQPYINAKTYWLTDHKKPGSKLVLASGQICQPNVLKRNVIDTLAGEGLEIPWLGARADNEDFLDPWGRGLSPWRALLKVWIKPTNCTVVNVWIGLKEMAVSSLGPRSFDYYQYMFMWVVTTLVWLKVY